MKLFVNILLVTLMLGFTALADAQNNGESATVTTDAVAALAAELVEAAGDDAAIAAIIARETENGNIDGLATALASAAKSVVQTNTTAAAALVIQAVVVADEASKEVQESVGEAASEVARVAKTNGDEGSASSIEGAILSSDSDTEEGFYGAEAEAEIAEAETAAEAEVEAEAEAEAEVEAETAETEAAAAETAAPEAPSSGGVNCETASPADSACPN
jgi:hypothetical protein